MSDTGEITLEGQAVEEILKEARRGKELAREFGSLAWQKRNALPNKRFFNNTLVSTLRHSYRKEEKTKNGSQLKYSQHMSRRRMGGRGRFRATHDSIQDQEPEPENVDYGEFDAMKYTDNCTNLYIRDSHRKHARMKEMFVEKAKKHNSSESEDSFTEDPEPPAPPENEWKHDKYEGKWQDTGSADEYDSNNGDQASGVTNTSDEESDNSDENIDSNVRYEKEFRKLEKIRKQKQIIKEYLKASRDYSKPSTSRDYDSNESKSDSEVSDSYERGGRLSRKSDSSNNSGTESAGAHAKRVKLNKAKQNQKQKKSQKLNKVDGKKLAELISQRSMYADIEELRGKGDVEQPVQTAERGVKDKRKHTAILMEDGEYANDRGRSRRPKPETMNEGSDRHDQSRGRKRSLENSFDRDRQHGESRDRNRSFDQPSPRGRPFNRSSERGRHDIHRSREREADSFWRGADRLSAERAEPDKRSGVKQRRKEEGGDGFWRGSSRDRSNTDSIDPRAPRGRDMDPRSFRDWGSPDRDRYPKKMDQDYLSEEERLPVRYKTIGDECHEEEMQEFHGHNRGGFRGRRPFRGRPPFMRGRFPGRPFRGRGGFMDPGFNPMMPVMNPIYASLMQEFLQESGFGTWLKKRAKKSHKSRRHSSDSSRSSSSRSRSRSHRRSHKYKKRRRRHSSSYSDSSRSRSRSRSRRRSRSQSRRRSYSDSSRSRSRHRSSRSRSRSYSRSRSRSRRSRSRSDRSRSRRHRSDSSRSRSRSKSQHDRTRSESKSYQDRTRDLESKSESRRESAKQESSATTIKRTRPSRFRDISPEESPPRSPSRSKSVSQPKGIFVPIPETNVEICEEVEEEGSTKDESVKLKLKKKSQKHGKSKRKKKSKKHKVVQETEVNPEEETFEEPGEIAELGEIEETEVVESSGNHLDENLENISSDNGQEWSSAEEGEL